jgi:hypothetical protein
MEIVICRCKGCYALEYETVISLRSGPLGQRRSQSHTPRLVPTASCTFYLLPSSCRPPPRTLSPRRSFKFRPSISLFLLSSDDLTQEGLTCPTSQLRWSSSVAPGPRGLTLSPSSNNDSPFFDFACITTLGRLNIVPASQLRWNFRVALSVSGTGAP